MKRITILLGLAVLFLAPVALADVPKLINFQGILRDGSGNPVADGAYTVRFRIYDDSTTAEANFLWSETVPVQTTSGLFNVRLGDDTSLPNTLFTGSNRFVGVKVNVDAEMSRLRLISVPYALHALRSDSATTATIALDLTCTGCVSASEVDATQVQLRVTGTAPGGEYVTGINQDGSVVTAIDQVGVASGWTDDGAVVRLSTSTDNVGIGTTSPQFGARLEVVDRVNVIGAGTSRVFIAKDGDEYLEASYDAASSRGQISTFNSSQPLILQQTGGNVGIGTISPGSRLQVEGQLSSSVTGAAAPGFTFTGDLNTGLFETVPDELGLATNGVDRLHIIGGGNVGIGTTSPAQKLDVTGTAQMTGFKLTTSPAAGRVLTSDATGVGTWQALLSSWSLTGNSGTNPSTNFLGTIDNQAFVLRVNNARALRVEPTATTPNLLGGYSGNFATSLVEGTTIGGGGSASFGVNRVTDDFGTVGGGVINRAGDNAGTTTDRRWATVGGGYGNNSSGQTSFVGGGYNNNAIGTSTVIGGGESNIDSADYASIGGGGNNVVGAGASYATIGGGVSNGVANTYATIGGGFNNRDSATYGTIAGGQSNIIGLTAIGATIGGGGFDTASGSYSTVAGGQLNVATGTGTTVSGGQTNRATGFWAAISGGFGNTTVGGGAYAAIIGGQNDTATGSWSAVLGGLGNKTLDNYSIAAGRRAKALHSGTFVWGDGTDADFASTATNQFLVRAANVGIGLNNPTKKLEVAGSIKVGTNDTVFSSNISSNSPLNLQAPAGTTRMYIDDVTGNVGIGTTVPTSRLHISNPGTGVGARIERSATNVSGGLTLSTGVNPKWSIILLSDGTDNLRIHNPSIGLTAMSFDVSNNNVGIGTTSPTTALEVAGQIAANPGSAAASAYTFAGDLNTGIYHPVADAVGISTGGTERMRISSSGSVGIGTTLPLAYLHVSRVGADVAAFDRGFDDGVIVRLYQAGVGEGTISVSGTTVSYNAFTGSHYGWTEQKLERGELVTLTGMNRNSHDNPKSEVIYGIKRSTVPNDPACLGSYLALTEPSKPASSENPHLIMAVGNGDTWVVDEGENIQPGDYLISSDVSGHAMKDNEEKYPIGHIVARAAEGVDWGSVGEMVGGRRHKKISVLFGNFVRTSVVSVNRLLELQQQQIERLEEKLEKMQGEKPQAKVE